MTFPNDLYNPNDPLFPGRRDNVVTLDEWLELIDNVGGIEASLGVNPATSTVSSRNYGTIDARLEAIEASLIPLARMALVNLKITNNATTPNSKLDISWDVLAIQGFVIEGFAVTLDRAVYSGGPTVNGRDFSGSIANNHWYYVYAIYSPALGTAATILSDGVTTPLLPLNYTTFRRIGSVVTDGVGNFRRYFQQDREVLYQHNGDSWLAAVNGVNAVVTPRTLSAFVPPTTRQAMLRAVLQAFTAGAGPNFQWRTTGSGLTATTVLQTALGNERAASDFWVTTDTAQSVDIGQSSTGTGALHYVLVTAFRDTI